MNEQDKSVVKDMQMRILSTFADTLRESLILFFSDRGIEWNQVEFRVQPEGWTHIYYGEQFLLAWYPMVVNELDGVYTLTFKIKETP